MPLDRAQPRTSQDRCDGGKVAVVKLSSQCGGERVSQVVGGRESDEFILRPGSSYRRFVFEGIVRESIWEHLNGQIYLGEEEFLGRMQNIVDRSAARGITKAQKKPLTPSVGEIINTVGSAYGISASEVLDRNHVEAYWLAAYLMRRVGNLPLGDVARRVGVSPRADFTDPDDN